MARSKPVTASNNTQRRDSSAFWERNNDIQAASSRSSVTTTKQPTAVSSPAQNYHYTVPSSPSTSFQPSPKPVTTVSQPALVPAVTSQTSRRDSSAYWSQRADTQNKNESNLTVPPFVPRQPLPVQSQRAPAQTIRTTGSTAVNSRGSSTPEKKSLSDDKDVDYLKLAFAIAEQGAGNFVGSITGAADWLLGDFCQELWTLGGETLGVGVGKNPVSKLNSWVQTTRKRDAEYAASLTKNNKFAEMLNKYGPDVVAVLPSLAIAAFTAPATAAASTLKAGKLATQTSPALSTAIKKVFSDKNAQLAFLEAGGNAYNEARERGADESQAAAVAFENGLFSAITSIGGLDDTWGGIERIYSRQNKIWPKVRSSQAREYVKSGFQEVGEDILSGFNERASHAIYDPNLPLYSATDANAPLNPTAIKEDAIHSAVSSTAASAAHFIPKTATAEVKRPLTPQDVSTQRDSHIREILSQNPRMSRAAAEQQSNALQRFLLNGNLEEVKKFNMANPAVADCFYEETGVRITPADTRDPRVLNNKFTDGVRNYQARYTFDPDTALHKSIDFPSQSGYTGIGAQPLPAGENAKYRNNFVIGTFAFRSPASGPSPLRPNSRYETDNHSCYLYTDGAARVRLTNGEISVSGPGRYSRAKAEIERMFSAMAPDLTNPNSRYRELSSGAYAGLQQLKQAWTPALAAGKTVSVSIEMAYSGASTVPDYYDVSYSIDGSKSIVRIYNGN